MCRAAGILLSGCLSGDEAFSAADFVIGGRPAAAGSGADVLTTSGQGSSPGSVSFLGRQRLESEEEGERWSRHGGTERSAQDPGAGGRSCGTMWSREYPAEATDQKYQAPRNSLCGRSYSARSQVLLLWFGAEPDTARRRRD